jgi:ribosomal protein L11 methyltransferase
LLGAGRVEAVDVDPEAIRATDANAERNGVPGVVHASLTPLDEVTGRFPIVVANIAAPTLVAMAPQLIGHATPGGSILVSGVLADQARAVTGAMAGAGARSVGATADGDWRALVFEPRG